MGILKRVINVWEKWSGEIEKELIKGSIEVASHSGDLQCGGSSRDSDFIQYLSAPKI